MDKAARLVLIFEDYTSKSPFKSYEAARGELERSINGIEDRFSGRPYSPPSWKADGRIYPPGDDFEQQSSLQGVREFWSLGHKVFFGNEGSVRIVRRASGEIVLDLPDDNGRTILAQR